MRFPAYIILPVFIFCFLISCSRRDSDINPIVVPVPDSLVVLRVDSLVLNTSTSYFVEQSFNFSNYLDTINFQYWGESDIPASHIPYILFTLRSVNGDSFSYVQQEETLDSIPAFELVMHNFEIGDSCTSIKIQLSMRDTVPPPYMLPNKIIKVKNLKVYSLLELN